MIIARTKEIVEYLKDCLDYQIKERENPRGGKEKTGVREICNYGQLRFTVCRFPRPITGMDPSHPPSVR